MDTRNRRKMSTFAILYGNLEKRGKYVKCAEYGLGYGGSINKVARTSKLGLRRTRVLSKRVNCSLAQLVEQKIHILPVTPTNY